MFVGLDIGGTKIIVAAADDGGNIVARLKAPTPPGLDDGISLLNRMIEAVLRGAQPAGIGAAIGGPLDWRQGIVSPLHQPEWRDVPLKKIMEAKWGCPFCVDVDTNVAALGEWHSGGLHVPRLLYITISTGMGGGFLIGGHIYRGMDDAHPEAAHQAINARCSHPRNVACECGAPDCLEALVSGNGIRRVYGKNAESLTESEWGEVGWNLGQGLRNLAVIYVPDVIVLGGGVALGRGRQLLDPTRVVMKSHLKLVPAPALRLSHLGEDSPLLGALAIAKHGLE